MTKEEMSREIQAEVAALESHAKQLMSVVQVLNKTLHQDANFAAMAEMKTLLDDLPEINVKQSLTKVRKALTIRAKERLLELSK